MHVSKCLAKASGPLRCSSISLRTSWVASQEGLVLGRDDDELAFLAEGPQEQVVVLDAGPVAGEARLPEEGYVLARRLQGVLPRVDQLDVVLDGHGAGAVHPDDDDIVQARLQQLVKLDGRGYLAGSQHDPDPALGGLELGEAGHRGPSAHRHHRREGVRTIQGVRVGHQCVDVGPPLPRGDGDEEGVQVTVGQQAPQVSHGGLGG
jgi:hypothetical protein